MRTFFNAITAKSLNIFVYIFVNCVVVDNLNVIFLFSSIIQPTANEYRYATEQNNAESNGIVDHSAQNHYESGNYCDNGTNYRLKYFALSLNPSFYYGDVQHDKQCVASNSRALGKVALHSLDVSVQKTHFFAEKMQSKPNHHSQVCDKRSP